MYNANRAPRQTRSYIYRVDRNQESPLVQAVRRRDLVRVNNLLARGARDKRAFDFTRNQMDMNWAHPDAEAADRAVLRRLADRRIDTLRRKVKNDIRVRDIHIKRILKNEKFGQCSRKMPLEMLRNIDSFRVKRATKPNPELTRYQNEKIKANKAEIAHYKKILRSNMPKLTQAQRKMDTVQRIKKNTTDHNRKMRDLAKKVNVKLTTKRNGKRVYKSDTLLNTQIANAIRRKSF